MKSWKQIQSDPRVAEAWSEGEDGYWVSLKAGLADLKHDPHYPHHTIHEWKVKDLNERLTYVDRCFCKDCEEHKNNKFKYA